MDTEHIKFGTRCEHSVERTFVSHGLFCRASKHIHSIGIAYIINFIVIYNISTYYIDGECF